MTSIIAVALLLFVAPFGKSASSSSISELLEKLNGLFVTTERPDDYGAIIVWQQEPAKLESYGQILFHQRATLRTMNRPYNQQLWKFTPTEDGGILIQHYDVLISGQQPDKRDFSYSDVRHLEKMDMILRKQDGVWRSEVHFEYPEYLSRFVPEAHSARVVWHVHGNAIEYHLQMFNVEGRHVYGPRERGYRLNRRE